LNNKLLLLNFVLLGATIYTGVQFRNQYLAAKARERAMLNQKIKPAPPPPMTPLPPAPPVMPSGYADIAQKMLFDKSRNPTVVVVVPPPPPPKPVPPFPVLKGMMNLGEGLTAVFSDKPGGRPMEVKPGDAIGPFTLVAVNEREAVFQWDGKTFRKSVDEIIDRSKESSEETSRPAPGAAPAAPAQPLIKSPTGPGAEAGNGIRVCNPNDSMPAGAVADGYRKVMISTPFGQACRWEAIGR